jgi:hypothetical protein
MIAMLVQIFAPIAACLAFSNSTADPFAGAICSHTTAANVSQDDKTDHQQSGGACCTLCCVVHAATPTADPQASAVKVEREVEAVIWPDRTFTLPLSLVGSNAQARGPPGIS